MAELNQVYRDQIDKLAETASGNAEAILSGAYDGAKWHTPEGWAGDPVEDFETDMHKPFDRDQLNDEVIESVSEADAGTSGEMLVKVLEIDSLAAQERAFRSRHITRVRSAVHAAARMHSHGQDGGIWKRSHRAYLERILKAASR